MSVTEPLQRQCGSKNDSNGVKRELMRYISTQKVVDDGSIITLKVIFHICFSVSDKNEIEKDCDYTIDMLNRDYNKTPSNFDSGKGIYKDPALSSLYAKYVSLATSCNIIFQKNLVVYCPMKRVFSSAIDDLDVTVKGSSPPIEPQKHLNLWIVDMDNGLLGYAQFPWELSRKPNTDGVLISKGTFGRNPEFPSYNLNKTLTHEAGHWLGLYHTFQDTFRYDGGVIDYLSTSDPEEYKGDCVADTIPQRDPTYGNPFNNPHYWPSSKPDDEVEPGKHMFMDYMDYSSDLCLFMFTKDQATKVRQMLHIYRPLAISDSVPISPFTYTNGFETPKDQADFVLTHHNGNSQFTTDHPYSGKKALRVNKNAMGTLTMDLSASTSSLNFNVRILPLNSRTKIWAMPSGTTDWLTCSIPQTVKYTNYTVPLPKPYGVGYKVALGTNGSDEKYAYFDEVRIDAETKQTNFSFVARR